MLRLLEAESASLSCPKEAGKMMFDEAISQLARSGMTHFGAIANKRAGEFMLSCEDEEWAQHYLSKSVELYGEWGASVKAEQLVAKYDFVKLGGDDDSGRIVPTFLQGREHFDSNRDSYARTRMSMLKAELSSERS
jgi:hypothetical protein